MSESEAGWEQVAKAWRFYRQRVFAAFAEASQWLVEVAAESPHNTVLELTAGPGETGLLAAQRLGPQGRVIITDISPTMVRAAQHEAESRGLTNVETRVMDAQYLQLQDQSVDVVICRMGMMLLADPHQALNEGRRVLKPGASFAYVTIGDPVANPWLSVLAGALMQHGYHLGDGNPFATGGPFSLCTPSLNTDLLGKAGYRNAHARLIDGAFHYRDANDYWAVMSQLTDPAREAVEAMSSKEIATVKATLGEMLEPFESTDGLTVPTQVVAARGEV